MKTNILTIITIAASIAFCSCNKMTDFGEQEYTPDAIDNNDWTLNKEEYDNKVKGLPTNDPSIAGKIASRLASTYQGTLTVDINGLKSVPSQQEVLIRATEDGEHINFGLYNFILDMNGTLPTMYVGNIILKDIPLTESITTPGNVHFEFKDDIIIKKGEPGIKWIAEGLKEIPVVLKGDGTAGKMLIIIDIDLSETLNQIIHVEFKVKDSDPKSECFNGTMISNFTKNNTTDIIFDLGGEQLLKNQKVEVGAIDANHINLRLKDIYYTADPMEEGDEDFAIGNIDIDNITLKQEPDGRITFHKETHVTITDGDNKDIEWQGPSSEMGEADIELIGELNSGKLNVKVIFKEQE